MIEKTVSQAIKSSSIPQNMYKKLIPSNSRCPKFYGRAKVHKENVPLRPVIDQISCPTYELSKYLKTQLSNIAFKSEFNVRNTKDFIHKLQNIKIDENDLLLSLDVKSLFTNVPLNEVVQIIKSKFEESNVPVDEIKLIEICLTSSYFSFKEKFYEQIDGIAMGSPLSPLIADVFMTWFEEKAIRLSPLKPKLYLRYVDDTFVVWQHGLENIEQFLNHMNGIHRKITFTVEIEKDGKLPFLDVLVIKEGEKLNHTVFRKATSTNKYLNANSHHHPTQKKGIVRNLINRAETICDPKYLNEELETIKNILEENDYKRPMIEHEIRNKRRKEARNETQESNIKRAVIPYVQGSTDKISKVLKKYNIKTTFSTVSKLEHMLPKIKDKTPKLKNKGVYQIPCSCSKVYIGETGRSVETRVKEHIRDDKNQKIKSSAIAEHTFNTKHGMEFDKVKLISREGDYFKRKVKEAIEIKKNKNNINREDGYKLSNTWLPILRK